MNNTPITLPAGVLDDDIEFFVDADLNAFKIKGGQVIHYDQFPEWLIDLVYNHLLTFPKKVDVLLSMNLTDRRLMVLQFLICNYGGFDKNPDIADGKMGEPEYWPCPKRGTCPHEGILCDNIKTPRGLYLTRQEIRVLELIGRGYFDKEIASILLISEHTVKSHNKNIRSKTGLARKADLTSFAHQKNLI